MMTLPKVTKKAVTPTLSTSSPTTTVGLFRREAAPEAFPEEKVPVTAPTVTGEAESRNDTLPSLPSSTVATPPKSYVGEEKDFPSGAEPSSEHLEEVTMGSGDTEEMTGPNVPVKPAEEMTGPNVPVNYNMPAGSKVPANISAEDEEVGGLNFFHVPVNSTLEEAGPNVPVNFTMESAGPDVMGNSTPAVSTVPANISAEDEEVGGLDFYVPTPMPPNYTVPQLNLQPQVPLWKLPRALPITEKPLIRSSANPIVTFLVSTWMGNLNAHPDDEILRSYLTGEVYIMFWTLFIMGSILFFAIVVTLATIFWHRKVFRCAASITRGCSACCKVSGERDSDRQRRLQRNLENELFTTAPIILPNSPYSSQMPVVLQPGITAPASSPVDQVIVTQAVYQSTKKRAAPAAPEEADGVGFLAPGGLLPQVEHEPETPIYATIGKKLRGARLATATIEAIGSTESSESPASVPHKVKMGIPAGMEEQDDDIQEQIALLERGSSDPNDLSDGQVEIEKNCLKYSRKPRGRARRSTHKRR